ncbi:MAG: polysaccharide biosynthesis tyrosine autokinase [Verrucomicrobiota bacterium]|nr:polysaccharide biosynthesis tyrosine autokinase [Verrucomicrobiota bacterium]
MALPNQSHHATADGHTGQAGQIYSPTTGAFIDSVGESRGFDLLQFWHALLAKSWVVVACVVAGLLLAIGYLAKTPKLYQGRVVLEVDVQDPTPIRSDDSSSRMRTMFLASQEAMRTIEQNLLNRSLLARVVRAEGLADDGGKALLGQSLLASGGNADAVPKATPSPAGGSGAAALGSQTSVTPVEEALAGALSTMVKPVIRRGTRLIDVYVLNRDPEMAQRLADAIGREYIRFSVERRAFGSQDALRYLMEEEDRLKKNLQKSEAAVADYKATTPDALQLGGGAATTGSQQGAGSSGGRGGLVEDKLQELSTKLTTARAERARLEHELQMVEQSADNVEALLAVPSIAAAPAVADRRRDVAQLEAVVAQLAQRYKEKHPKMMAARAALDEARDALRRTALSAPAILRNQLEQARAAEENLAGSTTEQERAAIALNKAAIGYQELARQAETDRALYESVLRQIKETNLTKDVKTTAVAIVERSPVARNPVSPRPLKSIMLGLLGGLAAGLGLVYGLDILDRSVKTVDQAEATLHLPVLAAVPEIGKADANESGAGKDDDGSATYRLVAEAPEGPAAEAFRNLRASLSLLGPEDERRVFLFTSAAPGEGKSFSSANYALALAQQGHRVLLIDGDLRRPSLHKIFLPIAPKAGEEDGAGIVDCLVGASELLDAARPVSAERLQPSDGADDVLGATRGKLYVLTGERRAPNPAEILSGGSFARLVSEASAHFDRVVIDSAPVLAVADTLLMTPLVQTICVVVRANKTPRNAVQRALGMLSGAGGRPAGIILNRLPKNRGGGYYYYYSSPGYGDGTYGSERAPSKKTRASTKRNA